MKLKRVGFSATLISLFTFYPVARADIIATRTNVMAGSTLTANTFEVKFGVTNSIFETLTLSAADVGQTFQITQTQDPDFNSLVSSLTDGRSETLNFQLSFNNFGSIANGISAPEKVFFSQLPAGNNGIDLQGFNIDSISLRIDSVSINSPNYSIRTTILVDAITVPEPSVGVLVFLGAMVLGRYRKRGRATD